MPTRYDDRSLRSTQALGRTRNSLLTRKSTLRGPLAPTGAAVGPTVAPPAAALPGAAASPVAQALAGNAAPAGQRAVAPPGVASVFADPASGPPAPGAQRARFVQNQPLMDLVSGMERGDHLRQPLSPGYSAEVDQRLGLAPVDQQVEARRRGVGIIGGAGAITPGSIGQAPRPTLATTKTPGGRIVDPRETALEQMLTERMGNRTFGGNTVSRDVGGRPQFVSNEAPPDLNALLAQGTADRSAFAAASGGRFTTTPSGALTPTASERQRLVDSGAMAFPAGAPGSQAFTPRHDAAVAERRAAVAERGRGRAQARDQRLAARKAGPSPLQAMMARNPAVALEMARIGAEGQQAQAERQNRLELAGMNRDAMMADLAGRERIAGGQTSSAERIAEAQAVQQRLGREFQAALSSGDRRHASELQRQMEANQVQIAQIREQGATGRTQAEVAGRRGEAELGALGSVFGGALQAGMEPGQAMSDFQALMQGGGAAQQRGAPRPLINEQDIATAEALKNRPQDLINFLKQRGYKGNELNRELNRVMSGRDNPTLLTPWSRTERDPTGWGGQVVDPVTGEARPGGIQRLFDLVLGKPEVRHGRPARPGLGR